MWTRPDRCLCPRSTRRAGGVDDALERLDRINPRQRGIVECRFFGGMTAEETAAAMGISSRTVKRDWALAQAWLYRELRDRV